MCRPALWSTKKQIQNKFITAYKREIFNIIESLQTEECIQSSVLLFRGLEM